MANLVASSTLSTHLVGGEIDFQALERIAIAELEENRIHGAAIAIVLGDKLAFAKGFGVANVETFPH
jgi:CubicO group peptidase (beta-lactamase class C family)